MKFKDKLKVQALAQYKAQQEGTKTLERAGRYKKDPAYRKELFTKYLPVAEQELMEKGEI